MDVAVIHKHGFLTSIFSRVVRFCAEVQKKNKTKVLSCDLFAVRLMLDTPGGFLKSVGFISRINLGTNPQKTLEKSRPI